MSRVLLTGGSGFIAAHVLDQLLSRGYSVVTTVRSQAKVDKIKSIYPHLGKDRLDFAIVEDIAEPTAFDEAVISEPPFEIVIHTASPFHFDVKDTQKDLLDPAVIGTTGILRAIKKSAPTVKRVVITSSFAALVDASNSPTHVYSEKDWNSITAEEAVKSPLNGYRASKTFAERAAWEFVKAESPSFSLATCNPPIVLGPIHDKLQTLDSLNTSNQRIRDIFTGAAKDACPPSSSFLWVDVRDVALAHVLAAEKAEAAGKRFFVVAGYFSSAEIARIISAKFPKYADNVPTGKALEPGEYPPKDQLLGYDNSQTANVLGMRFRSLEESVVDTVKSMEPLVEKKQ